jgi:hypothetical protein
MSGKTFDKLAPQVMRDFMAEFDLKDFQAAGILGNLGHESGFMRHELRGPEKRAIPALKKTTSLETATKSFEKTYERAGVKAYDERVKWAKRALRLYNQAEDAVVA